MIAIWTAPAPDDRRSIDAWLTREAAGAVAERMLVAIRYRARIIEDCPRIGRHGRENRQDEP